MSESSHADRRPGTDDVDTKQRVNVHVQIDGSYSSRVQEIEINSPLHSLEDPTAAQDSKASVQFAFSEDYLSKLISVTKRTKGNQACTRETQGRVNINYALCSCSL